MKLAEKSFIGLALLALSLCLSYASAEPGKSMTRKGSFEIEKVRDLISDQRSGLKSEAVRRKIEARINSLISGKMKRSGLRGLILKEQIVGHKGKVKLVLNTSNKDIDGISRKLKYYGARIIKRRNNIAALEVPVNNLEKMVNEIDILKNARPPFRFFPQGEISEGVSLTESDNFHNIDFKGAGVKIAVIDVGFKELTEAYFNGDIPYNTRTRDFTGKGIGTEYYHGTACAEIIHDMAPEAELHLLKVSNEIDILDALDYCVDNDIDIISLSIGTFGTGPGDGTGPLDEAFDGVRANGILVVAVAGNQGNTTVEDVTFGSHWEGVFIDYDDDNFHEFIPEDNESIFNIIGAVPEWDDDGNPETNEVTILLRWDDWPVTDIDYDMFLFELDINEDEEEPQIVAYSDYEQDGTQPPIEYISLDIPDNENYAHYYALVIVKQAEEPQGTEMEIHLGGTSMFLPYDESHPYAIATSASSIIEPADAESVFAVGAIDYYMNWETGPQEDFSSQGPTNAWAGSSERIKPDIMGSDGVTTFTYGNSSFLGTSAAAPHVAGLAALILSLDPGLSPDELQSFIETNAIDMGDTGKDNIYGWGRIKAVLNFPIVKSFQKISNTEGTFTGTLDVNDYFGSSVASLGDLNGDGITDLAVGASGDSDGAAFNGAVWILFMNKDGTVNDYQKISDTEGNFTGTFNGGDNFGGSVVSLGDLNGDSVKDLAVGTSGDSYKGAIWILFMNKDGTVNDYQKISDTEGNFTGTLDYFDYFGSSVASLGDLNGDGITDLALGAWGDDDGGDSKGALWILFMNTDGTVNDYQKISDTEGDFTGTLDNNDLFGSSVASLGDLNGDGITDLAVGASSDSDGGICKGAVWILFMNTEGTVNDYQKISDTEGNFTSTLDSGDNFGSSVVSLGDLNGDGVTDLAVGASSDSDGGTQKGAVWILFMNTEGTVNDYQKISNMNGYFTGRLDDYDYFGSSVASLGDLNSDGITDLAIGAYNDADGGPGKGAVWILFLDTIANEAADKDNDGMSDNWEIVYGLDPDSDDSAEDPDGDGYININEFKAGTDPHDADTDDDGISDGNEDENQNQFLDAGETHALHSDTDDDGIQDGTEKGVTISVADPDGGGPLLGTDATVFIPDADPNTTTDPSNMDTDNDGLKDGEEDTNHNGSFDEGETDSNNMSPNAHAGSDQSVAEGSTVTLDGSGSSDPDDIVLSYLWEQTGGPSVTLSDSTAVRPTFVTPPVNPGVASLIFRLTVTDGSGESATDEVSITVNENSITGFNDDVVTLKSSTYRNVGIEVTGGACVYLVAVNPSTISNNTNRPTDLIYGLFNIRINTATPGGTAYFTYYFPEPAPAGYKWFKYTTSSGWSDFSANASFNSDRTAVTLTLRDGGAGDDDGTANGVIVDPSGLGFAPVASSSPSGGGGGGGGGGGAGIFGDININKVLGYHLDGITKDGIRKYMPVTQGFKALKGAQTHIEEFAPDLASFIRKGFDTLEIKARSNENGLLYTMGTYIFPVLGRIAEIYLNIFDSRELMDNAYIDTTISVEEFNKSYKYGTAISSQTVKEDSE
jgi:hypothetical protein